MTFTGGQLDGGQAVELKISAKASASADKACLTNSASVIGNEADPTPSNDTATSTTCVEPGSLSWNKTDPSGKALDGSVWKLTGPDGTSATITDNGDNDQNPTAGELKVTGLVWGNYTLVETKAPVGYLLDDTPIGVTVDSGHTQVDLSAITNTLAEPGLHVVKTSDPASGSTVKPGQTITYTVKVENTGNVDLTTASIRDDLSEVLDHTTFVAGSARAVIGSTEAATPTVDEAGGLLTWEDTLGVGQTATITYSVIVNQDVTAQDRVVNVVTAQGSVPPGITPPTSNCVADTAAQTPECTTEHVPTTPVSPSTPTPSATPSVVGPSTLPTTGASVVGPVAGGLVLLGPGASLFAASRRRSMR